MMRRHQLVPGCTLAAVLAAGLALRRRYAVVTVTGDSMLPGLLPGDRVLVRRTRTGRLRRGQVVVAEIPGADGDWEGPPRGPVSRREWMIKRLAAVPGDPRPADSLPATADPAGRQVPPGKFVVLGDNPALSHDSRQIGYIPGDRVLGVAIRRIHAEPLSPAGALPAQYPGIPLRPETQGQAAACPDRTRAIPCQVQPSPGNAEQQERPSRRVRASQHA